MIAILRWERDQSTVERLALARLRFPRHIRFDSRFDPGGSATPDHTIGDQALPTETQELKPQTATPQGASIKEQIDTAERELFIHRAHANCFRAIGDGIAWRALGHDRAALRALSGNAVHPADFGMPDSERGNPLFVPRAGFVNGHPGASFALPGLVCCSDNGKARKRTASAQIGLRSR